MTIPSNAIPTPISQLPLATDLLPTDVTVVVSGGRTAKAPISSFAEAFSGVPESRQIIAGGALTGGGTLAADVTISLNTIGNGGGPVGGSTSIPILSWDTYGRVTDVSSVTAATPSLNQVITVGGNTGTESLILSSLAVSGSLTRTSTPTLQNDVVRLIDLQEAQLLNYRDPVAYVSIANITGTYTRVTGISTDTIVGAAPLVIDGVTITAVPPPNANARVLLTAQQSMPLTGGGTIAANVGNGPYTITAASATGFTLTRSPDTPSYGNYYFVLGGNTEDSTSWINNTSGLITVGTTPITYVQFFASPNAGNTPPLASGVAAPGNSVLYSRADHVHPLSATTAAATTMAPGGALGYTGSVLTFTPATPTTLAVGTAAGTALSGALVFTGSNNNTTWTLSTIANPTQGGFLRSDGTWATPSGTGLSAVTLVPPAGFSATSSVASNTATVTLSYATTAKIPAAQLGTGTADNTTYLSGPASGTQGVWRNPWTSPTLTNPTLSNPTLTATTMPAGSITITGLAANTAPSSFLSINSSGVVSTTAIVPAANGGTGLVSPTGYVRFNGAMAATTTAIANADLANSSVTIGTTAIALGASSLTLAGLTSVSASAAPVNANDLTNKAYVDSAVSATGRFLSSVRAATTADITLSGTQTIDGIALAIGDEALVKNQTDASQNGTYTVAAGPWTRRDTLVNLSRSSLLVRLGNTQASTGWTCTSATATTVTFVQSSASVLYQAGAGLTLTGTTFAVSVDNRSIAIGSNGLEVRGAWDGTTSTGAAQITKLGTITLGTWNGSVITVPFGGTGRATIPSGNLLTGAGTGALTSIAPSTTNGQVLTVVNGAWAAAALPATGTVTSFSAVVPTGLAQAVATPTTTPALTLTWNGQIPPSSLGTGTASNTTYLAGPASGGTAGVWTTFPTITSGTVTSVNLTVPAGFRVTGAPITAAGTIAVAYDPNARIPASSLASGTATTGFIPTVQANGSLAYAAPSEPLAIVYAIALG